LSESGGSGSPAFVAKNWNNREPFGNLFILLAVQSILTEFSITAIVPAGSFIPSLIIGGTIGRILAESLMHVASLNPGGYALVGATAFSAAFTQTFSSIPILIDITGQVLFFLPMAIAATVSISVSRVLGYVARVPFLRQTRYEEYHHGLTAKDVLDCNFMFITQTMTVPDLGDLLALYSQRTFPVVNNKQELKFLGTVESDTLIHLLQQQLNPPKAKRSSLSKIVQLIKDNYSSARDSKTHKLRREELLQKAIQAAPSHEILIPYNLPDIHVVNTTPFDDLNLLFTMLRWSWAFVTEEGKLVGSISRERLFAAEEGVHQGLQIKGMFLD